MGLRGPVPKSAAERVYEGSAAHRPLPSARESAVCGIPERPKGMAAAARRFWTFYTGQMLSLGTLRPVDGPGLEMICELHADLERLKRDKRKLVKQRKQMLAEFEMSLDGRRLEATINGKRSHLKQLCDRYGLNPMSGSRLSSMDNPMAPHPVTSAMEQAVNEIEARIQ